MFPVPFLRVQCVAGFSFVLFLLECLSGGVCESKEKRLETEPATFLFLGKDRDKTSGLVDQPSVPVLSDHVYFEYISGLLLIPSL